MFTKEREVKRIIIRSRKRTGRRGRKEYFELKPI